ncbi:hypothetical protein [Flavobacterium limnophilum]|uniref:hypothetical protein n=1 Tax=Flavobacterium limnophilum TaxID=3003262 RepID=UPI0022AC621A|nr:hypothetical protein [Flavobacterium limnophilum]
MNEFKRPDLSSTLIHFTKGENDDEAFENLYSILIDKCINATKFKSLEDNEIVCLTETPLKIIMEYGFTNHTNYSNYRKFGLMFDKEEIYKIYSGRPALYLEKKCFNKLSNDLKWRFALFEPSFKYKELPKKPFIDFTWEREWRVQGDLYLSDCDNNFIVLVPNLFYKNKLEDKIRDYFTNKFEDCNVENPRYLYELEYDYIEGIYFQKEIENEENCECNVFDPDDNILNIILLDKM